MPKRSKPTLGFEIEVNGPTGLSASTPQLIMWTAQTCGCGSGTVKLDWLGENEATLLDLDVSGCREHRRASAKLIAAVAEYARERGILKLRIHENSHNEWVCVLLSRMGFRNALRKSPATGIGTEFYLDLYHSTRRRGGERSILPGERLVI